MRHAATDCPYCRRQLDASTDPRGDARPSAGDATLCAYCGQLLIDADDELRLRRPTAEEVEEAEGSPGFGEARRLVLAAIAARGATTEGVTTQRTRADGGRRAL
jgi:hypothetical protein